MFGLKLSFSADTHSDYTEQILYSRESLGKGGGELLSEHRS